MAQRLRGRGVTVEAFTFSSASVGHLALTLYRLLRDRLLDLPDDDELTAELSSVVLRESQPGNYRIDTTGTGHDDRVISLALVAQNLASQSSGILRISAPPRNIVAAPIGRRLMFGQKKPPVPVVKENQPRPIENCRASRTPENTRTTEGRDPAGDSHPRA